MRTFDRSYPARPMAIRVLKPSGRKRWGMVIGCLAFVAGGFFMLFYSSRLKDIVTGLMTIAFFGAGGVFYVVKMIYGRPELRLDSEGFSLVTFGRATRYRWTEVRDFGISGNSVVRFPWSPGSVRFTVTGPGNGLQDIGAPFSGYVGLLPDNYGMRLEDLVDLMNSYRERALAGRI